MKFNLNNSYQNSKTGKLHFLVLLISLLLIIVIGYLIGIAILKRMYPTTYFEIVEQQASQNDLDPYLILSIIKVESGFNKSATSPKEAKGLMQIINSTAIDINNREKVVDAIDDVNIYDEKINIALGCQYFASLVKRYSGNYYLAICAYNAGLGNVDKWIEQGIIDKNLKEHQNVNLPFKETSKYLDKVISSYKMYQYLYEK